MPGKSNYFIGNLPERWRTGIPNYAKVRYRNVYPGVDMIYYGNQRQLEYDFVVGAGADPDSISLEFEGPQKVELDGQGHLLMRTSAGDVQWHKPVAYQEIEGSRKFVECAYVRSGGHLTFSVDAYDRAKPLVIDPVLNYSTYLGGSDSDGANVIAVDGRGNAYVTGTTSSLDFPVKHAFQSSLSLFASQNAFITKFDATGNLVYSTFLGGGANGSGLGDYGTGIAVDCDGYAYVTGATSSTDFPIKNAFQKGLSDEFSAFIAKLGTGGDALVYSTYLGGSGGIIDVCDVHCFDWGNAIAVDTRGYAYVTGYTQSLDFPTKNPFQKTNKAGLAGHAQNAFVTKLCPDGNALIYSTYLGGSISDQGNGIAVDAHGKAYVTGTTASLDFPIKGAFQGENRNKFCTSGFGDVCNAFVTKLDVAGNALVYSTYLGGSGKACYPNTFQCFGDSGTSIAVGQFDDVYVTGVTYSADFPTKNAFQRKLNSAFGNAFVTHFDADGAALIYSTYLGGTGNSRLKLGDEAYGITVDAQRNVYVTGYTASSDFPAKNAFQEKLKSQFGNAFVTKLDADGDALIYSTYLGGSGGFCDAFGPCSPSDSGNGIAVDKSGNTYVAGVTNAANFPTKNAYQPEHKGFTDAFVTKISAY